MTYGLWAALSLAIAQMPCSCTENDSCPPHELLDELFAQHNTQPAPAA